MKRYLPILLSVIILGVCGAIFWEEPWFWYAMILPLGVIAFYFISWSYYAIRSWFTD